MEISNCCGWPCGTEDREGRLIVCRLCDLPATERLGERYRRAVEHLMAGGGDLCPGKG